MTAGATLADIGTAAGTLVLAGATFVSVRASARSTRIAERALLAGQRPVLAPAGPDELERIAQPWRPFRTWASVLIRAAGARLLQAQ